MKWSVAFTENPKKGQTFFLSSFVFESADVDECQLSDACHSDHVCNNTIGSYTCECAPGFTKSSSSQNNQESICNGEEIGTHYLRNIN